MADDSKSAHEIEPVYFPTLREKASQAPTTPGCYLWKNGRGETLYVGKAINLRARLKNYLGPRKDSIKTYILMRHAVDLEWISTDTDRDALLLEADLVKKHKPRFNVRLKDDKRYPYICVSTSEAYPQISVTRAVRDDGNRYFGPYTDVRATRNTIALIHKIFPIRKVRQKLPLKKPARPCMNFHIKRCLGPCQGTVPVEEYDKIVREIILFLEGKREILETVVSRRMNEYSAAEEYEKASIYRDMLLNIRRSNEQQSVVQGGSKDEDIIAFARRDDNAQIVVFEVRGGRLLDRKSFPLAGAESASDAEILTSFLRDHYLGASQMPTRIHVPEKVAARERNTMAKLLSERSERNITIHCRSRHEQVISLTRMASRNAELLLGERLLATKLRDRDTALNELAAMLKLPESPGVIECYDISHTQGSETVASGVVFVDGSPHRPGYRHYRIRAVTNDDPAAIREVIARRIQRLKNDDRAMPDLIVIDGGLNQLNAACEALKAMDAGDLAVVSLAKKKEEIYVPGESRPLAFDPNQPGMRLLRQLRDEAHRFAINHHRQRRNKATMRHVLDTVGSIGPERRKAILKHFSDQKIEEASLEMLIEVPGIGPSLAKRIFEAMRQGKREPQSTATETRTVK